MKTPCISSQKFWRIFAGVTFVNQLIRVPLLLTLATSVKDLEVYFIVTATSIPVQFFAQEILQYRNKSHKIQPFERYGLPLLVVTSILYVTWHHGIITGCIYLAFAFALLLYSASVGLLREISSAHRILAIDAMYNTGTTILACTLALVMTNTSALGLTILLAQATIAVCMTVFIGFLVNRSKSSPVYTPVLETVERVAGSSAPLVLAGIMLTTQLERLVIAATQPFILACISLAAGAAQALRKLGMDDAVVYQALRQNGNSGLYQAMCVQLRQARVIFYVPLLLALIASAFISDISDLSHQFGVLRSLDEVSFSSAASILCIYLAALPPGIVMINTLRLRIAPLHLFGTTVLGVTAIVLCVALLFPEKLAQKIELPLAIIILNASLSHTLFMALCPTPLLMSFRLLRIDVAVFLITVLILWLLHH